jgi:hypothetical protein
VQGDPVPHDSKNKSKSEATIDLKTIRIAISQREAYGQVPS